MTFQPMRRVIGITNSFPPNIGGVETFTLEIATRLPENSLVIVAPDHPGSNEFDRNLPFPVVRFPGKLSPFTPGLANQIIDIAKQHSCDRVWISELFPLGLLSASLKAGGLDRVIAQSHGAELVWARLPLARSLVRYASTNIDAVTYLGAYTRKRLKNIIDNHAKLERLAPGVDVKRFHRQVSGAEVRQRHGLGDRPVIVCVSRLVPRKGQDTLIRILPEVANHVPDVCLLIVGSGPYEGKLRSMRNSSPLRERIIFAGKVKSEDLPAHYAAGNVFAMPCRSRFCNLEVEGLGIVFLEASACGLPVIAGNSGGAPDAVIEGRTGYVVDGRNQKTIAARLVKLLLDGKLAQQMGSQGQAWTAEQWNWDRVGEQMRTILWPE